MFHHPTLGLQNGTLDVNLHSLNLSSQQSTIPFHVRPLLWVNNPNSWPFSFTVRGATANVYSLDARQQSREIFMGVATLAGQFDVKTHSHTLFNMVLDGTLDSTGVTRSVSVSQGDSLQLRQRLLMDCVSLGGGTTTIGVQLIEVEVTIFGSQQEINRQKLKEWGLDTEHSVPIPCPAQGTAWTQQGAVQPGAVPPGQVPPPARALVEVTHDGTILRDAERKQIREHGTVGISESASVLRS